MSALLEMQGVSKSFGGLQALKDVTLDVHEGEILGLIGPNGAGKTTLFNLISGAIRADEGGIRFREESLVGLPAYAVAERGIARTFQVVKPFGQLSVLANVMVGSLLRVRKASEAQRRATAVVHLVGLEPMMETPASSLTLAARKRLELARALATEPTLLLLDEVMAGLTPTEGAEMVQIVRDIRSTGISILLIEHVMAAVMSVSDRIAVLHHGEVLAVGTPSGIARDQTVIDAYLGEEFRIAGD
jgi:branched-chain amino acid transport system ATP-binding protein